METNKIGAFYAAGGTEFIVWAPLANKVDLVIETGSPAHTPMVRDAGGYWRVKIDVPAESDYRFRLDDQPSLPDPASLSQPQGVHGASRLVDRSQFFWKDGSWSGISVSEMIIYEIHTGTFTDLHDFAGIRGRLDYLKNLGVNTIELMPVASFGGTRNWGYDGVFPFAVQSSYGGADELKNLVNEAHSKGIAVLLDVVYNHLGPEGNILNSFGPYASESRSGHWGSFLNFDGPYSDGVRNYFIENALMWLDEFHLDGLRLDAVHAIQDLGAKHFVSDLQEAVDELEKKLSKKKILIAEIDLNDPRYLKAPEAGGYGLDAQWNDEFHHALHTVLTGEKNGYYEDFGALEQLAKAYTDVFIYNGNYSGHRKRNFGSPVGDLANDRFVVFSQNHDQTGNRLLGERLSTLISFEALKLAAAAVILSPFIPLLFMGEEYGEKNPFLFFVDFEDQVLLDKVRQGRKKEFSHFNHTEDFADPADANTFYKTVLSWNYFDASGETMLRWYQWLIALRTTNAALRQRSRQSVDVSIQNESVLQLGRSSESEHMLILFNYSKDEKRVSLPGHFRGVLLADSSATDWRGPGTESVVGTPAEIILNPYAVQIYSTLSK